MALEPTPNFATGEPEEEERKYLSQFKDDVKGIHGLVCPLDDIFLLRFLRAEKFNADAALTMIQKYFEVRRQNMDIFTSVCPSSIKCIHEGNKGCMMVLKNRDALGRKILFIQIRMWNFYEFDYNKRFMFLFYLLEEMLCSEETQRNGFVVLDDHGSLSFYQTKRIVSDLSIKRMKMGFQFFHAAFGNLFQSFHMVNNQYVFSILYAIASPFLDEGLKKRMKIHGKNVQAVYEFISPDILPKSIGGKLTDEEAEDLEFMNVLYSKEDYYKEFLQFGYQF